MVSKNIRFSNARLLRQLLLATRFANINLVSIVLTNFYLPLLVSSLRMRESLAINTTLANQRRQHRLKHCGELSSFFNIPPFFQDVFFSTLRSVIQFPKEERTDEAKLGIRFKHRLNLNSWSVRERMSGVHIKLETLTTNGEFGLAVRCMKYYFFVTSVFIRVITTPFSYSQLQIMLTKKAISFDPCRFVATLQRFPHNSFRAA